MLHPSKYEGESISIRPPLTTTFSISFFTISLFPKKAHPELSSHPQKKSYYQNDACKSELYAKRISTLMIAKLSTQEFDACNSTKLRKLKWELPHRHSVILFVALQRENGITQMIISSRICMTRAVIAAYSRWITLLGLFGQLRLRGCRKVSARILAHYIFIYAKSLSHHASRISSTCRKQQCCALQGWDGQTEKTTLANNLNMTVDTNIM